ncbi:MAG TPA: hypothetical protein VFT38_05145, partial [Vicinamibacteria bacterium]|nr:hypothetical protein [Vicinamibacteria bacterium]
MKGIVILSGVAAACGALVLGGARHAAAQGSPASPAAKVDRKAFSNTWKLNLDESEKFRDKMRQARGGERGGGGGGRGGGGGYGGGGMGGRGGYGGGRRGGGMGGGGTGGDPGSGGGA